MANRRTDRKVRNAVRFEPSDVPALLPLWLAAGLGSFVILLLAAISLGYPLAVHEESRGPTRPLPQSPRLQVAPAADLDAYQAAKTRELATSPTPIDQAMKATVKQGWGAPQ